MEQAVKLYQLIVKVGKGRFSAADLKPEMTLREDLGFDSLAQSELVVLVEDAFGVKVDYEAALKVDTVAGILAFLEGHNAA